MKLDTHLHVLLKPFFGRQATDTSRLLDELFSCGLDGGWISSMESMLTRSLAEQKAANDALAGMVSKCPDRLYGLCTVDPNAMEQAALEVERCVETLGMIGVKLHPWLQAFSVTHPGVALLAQVAAKLGVPVLFHDGTPPYATPRQIEWLARQHPETTIILGHVGLNDYWQDAVDVGRNNSNVWLQPTAAPPRTIRAALDAAGPARILFGSDAGYGSTGFLHYVIAKYREALGDSVFDRVLLENPIKIRQQRKNAFPATPPGAAPLRR
jgi:uncharacterized protein